LCVTIIQGFPDSTLKGNEPSLSSLCPHLLMFMFMIMFTCGREWRHVPPLKMKMSMEMEMLIRKEEGEKCCWIDWRET